MVCALCALCAGCAGPSEVGETPSALPSDGLSKAEALQRARQIYEGYLEITAEVASDGGTGLERFSPYLTDVAVERERRDFKDLREADLRIRGKGDLIAFELQNYSARRGELSAYACVDLSATRVINMRGADVTPKERFSRQTSLALFRAENGALKLQENAKWNGDTICPD